jgi:hypothetical protein
VLEEVQENLVQLIEERSAIITYDALPQVHANRVQMIRLFQNFVANAIWHCDKAVSASPVRNHRQKPAPHRYHSRIYLCYIKVLAVEGVWCELVSATTNAFWQTHALSHV